MMQQKESAARQALRKKRARKRAIRLAGAAALAAALGAGKRCAFRDVDGELDLAVGGVDALAARARRLRKPLRQVGGDDDQTPRDPWARRDGQVVHTAQLS